MPVNPIASNASMLSSQKNVDKIFIDWWLIARSTGEDLRVAEDEDAMSFLPVGVSLCGFRSQMMHMLHIYILTRGRMHSTQVGS